MLYRIRIYVLIYFSLSTDTGNLSQFWMSCLSWFVKGDRNQTYDKMFISNNISHFNAFK